MNPQEIVSKSFQNLKTLEVHEFVNDMYIDDVINYSMFSPINMP